jgi:hypothetical protein
MEEVYEIPTKDKLPRKKYMGEWRCQSILIRTMRQVSCQSHKVDSQKQHKKDNLQLWIL